MSKCGECGFLAVDIGGDAKTADEHVRNEGQRMAEDGANHWAKLICSKGCEAFEKIEYASPLRMNTIGPERQQGIADNKAAITKERECKAFREWIEGKSPEEHEKMEMYETVRRIEIEQIKLTKQIAALSQVHHNENIDVAKQENSINLAGIAVSAVVALLVALITAYVTCQLNQ